MTCGRPEEARWTASTDPLVACVIHEATACRPHRFHMVVHSLWDIDRTCFRLHLFGPRRPGRECSGLTGLLLDPVGELGDLVEDDSSSRHLFFDLALGVHDGGVVAAAELLADPR